MSVLSEIGQDSARVLTRADSEEIRATLVAQTDVARSLGIFGSPTFVVGTETFWGDDRLDDALRWHGEQSKGATLASRTACR